MTPYAPSSSGHDRPRIIHVIPRDGLGGVETAARSAAKAAAENHDFTLFFLAGPTIAAERDHIRDHPDRGLNHPLTYIRAVRDVAAARPDVLVTSLWRAMLVGIAVKLARPATRWACLLHSTRPVHLADRLVQWLSVRLADEVWADSPTTVAVVAGRGSKPRRTLSFVPGRPGIAARPPAPGLSFVNWSRLEGIKGHDRAIALIGVLKDRGGDPSYVIWGPDAGAGARLRGLVSDLGLEPEVRFAGPLEPGRLDQVAGEHVFYLGLSRQEGMGMSVVEAMQRGLIPVVTAVGEVADYVKDGVNGLIVDPTDLSAAVQRVAELVQLPVEIERMALAAWQTWQHSPLYADDFFAAAGALWSARRDPQATQ